MSLMSFQILSGLFQMRHLTQSLSIVFSLFGTRPRPLMISVTGLKVGEKRKRRDIKSS